VLGPFPEALMDEKRPGTSSKTSTPFPFSFVLFKPNVLRLGENSPSFRYFLVSTPTACSEVLVIYETKKNNF